LSVGNGFRDMDTDVRHFSTVSFEQDAWDMPAGHDVGELADAQDEINEAEKGGKMTATSVGQSFLEVATLIFVAEVKLCSEKEKVLCNHWFFGE
jgi:hypothetical protein